MHFMMVDIFTSDSLQKIISGLMNKLPKRRVLDGASPSTEKLSITPLETSKQNFQPRQYQ